MDDLLKEAIADAKAVRETALANAKLALEEAFTPKLKSMLSQKIQSEIEEDDEAPEEEEEAEEAEDEGPGDFRAQGFGVDEPAVEPEVGEEIPEQDDEEEAPEAPEEEAPEEEEMEEEGVIEINGVQYAPVVSEQDEEEEAGEEAGEEEAEMEEEDLDLEAILRELETEADELEEQEAGAENSDDEVVDDLTDAGADSDSDIDSSDVGDADNKEPSGEASDSSDVGQGSEEPADSGDAAEGEEGEEEVVDDLQDNVQKDGNPANEDIDLEEILRALSEEDEAEESVDEVEELQNELGEHRKVVQYLRSKLNEVNLLNAKLLFTNKLFRAHAMTEDKKVKVIEQFDRARTLREVKLVYATLAEAFGKRSTAREITESKGSASKPVASTKSKKVISEGSDLKDRFKKLANII